jgi:hypothetical protein
MLVAVRLQVKRLGHPLQMSFDIVAIVLVLHLV